MKKSPVVDWLYLKWRQREDTQGKRISQKEFSQYLRVSTNFLSMVLSGSRKVGYATVSLWAGITGDDSIYDLAGFSDRKPRQVSFLEFLDSMPRDRITSLFASVREINSIVSETGINVDTPEGFEMVKEVFRKYGL